MEPVFELTDSEQHQVFAPAPIQIRDRHRRFIELRDARAGRAVELGPGPSHSDAKRIERVWEYMAAIHPLSRYAWRR
jgi:hypothetical protein